MEYCNDMQQNSLKCMQRVVRRTGTMKEVNIRAATSMEHCKDMQQPSFDTCNVPFVVYAPWPYNALETFTRLYMNLLNGKMRETMSPKLTPVVGTPRGLKMATFTRPCNGADEWKDGGNDVAQADARSGKPAWLEDGQLHQGVLEKEPTTLAELSNRGAACEAGSATIEQDMSVNEFGLRPTPKNRCFQNLYLQEGHATGVIKAATHLVNFYKTHLLLKKEKLASAGHWAWQGVDANTMRVVIATREGHGSRLIVNREDLVTECQKWVPKHLDGGTAQPTEGSVPSQSKGVRMKQWSQAKCVIYNFGDPIADMALMQETDVLVSLHGSSCMNAFYMPEGSTLMPHPRSVVEVLSDAHFEAIMKSGAESGKLTVVDFTAKWCGPCKAVAPVYEQLSKSNPNVTFLKVDIDNQGLMKTPTFVFYQGATKVDGFSGARVDYLKDLIAGRVAALIKELNESLFGPLLEVIEESALGRPSASLAGTIAALMNSEVAAFQEAPS
eukprot:gene15143-21205_t